MYYDTTLGKLQRDTGLAWEDVADGILTGCYVTKAAVQSVNDSSATALTFDTETRDDNGCHESVTNPTRLSAPVAGWYIVGCTIACGSDADGKRVLDARANGATYIAQQEFVSSAGEPAANLTMTVAYYLAAGEYVEFVLWHNAGAAINITAKAWLVPAGRAY
jgi:hypothetical protein